MLRLTRTYEYPMDGLSVFMWDAFLRGNIQEIFNSVERFGDVSEK